MHATMATCTMAITPCCLPSPLCEAGQRQYQVKLSASLGVDPAQTKACSGDIRGLHVTVQGREFRPDKVAKLTIPSYTKLTSGPSPKACFPLIHPAEPQATNPT